MAASLIGVFLFLLASTPTISAQTYTVIHDFTGGQDGANPYTGLTIDAAGNLYGTATVGGGSPNCQPIANGCGVVFRMKPSGSGWSFLTIYAFQGNGDGSAPESRVLFGPSGALYGTTLEGGNSSCIAGCGTVFNLQPPITTCRSTRCPWNKTTLYNFTGVNDGFYPSGELAFDATGSVYGTTMQSNPNAGIAYKLSSSAGNWNETILHFFTGQADGGNPESGMIFDSAGNLYGTAPFSGQNNGVVFELSASGGTWTFSPLYTFQGNQDGAIPIPALTFDGSGNLFGATVLGGSSNGGTAYELVKSGGTWDYNLLLSFPGSANSGPYSKLLIDASGNLYGTTTGTGGPSDYGSVFKLTRSGSGWTETVLHRFTGSDGSSPYCNLVMDSHGNLYGTTDLGGANGLGVVFEITP